VGVDISVVDNSSIKIRGKSASFIVDAPTSGPKLSADGVISLTSAAVNTSRISDSRIVISGPGEYEVNGIKISGIAIDGGIVYRLIVDEIEIVLGKLSELAKADLKISSCDIALLNADSDLKESVVTALEPRFVVMYGDKKKDLLKAMGKENVSPTSKFTITKDKLPEEMGVAVLGN